MPFDSQGNFTRVHSWEQDRINDIDIMSDRHDEEDDGFAAAFNECMLRDGRNAFGGNLRMSNYQIKNLANGQSSSDAVNKGQLDAAVTTGSAELKALINAMVPVGDIKASLATANHGCWLLCNGQAVSRTAYSALFALIGTHFGAGDGTSTFNVPDYRGKFLRGLGGNAAADVYTTQAEGLPDINGEIASMESYQYHGTTGSGAFTVEKIGIGSTSSAGETSSNKVTFSAANSNAIYGASAHVTPVNQAVNWFIKAKEE